MRLARLALVLSFLGVWFEYLERDASLLKHAKFEKLKNNVPKGLHKMAALS